MNRLHDVRSSGAQVQTTSTGTANVQSVAPPGPAGGPPLACLVSVETNAARVTFDGSTPAATNGHVFQAGAAPLYLPFATLIKFVSTIAGNALLNVTWLY